MEMGTEIFSYACSHDPSVQSTGSRYERIINHYYLSTTSCGFCCSLASRDKKRKVNDTDTGMHLYMRLYAMSPSRSFVEMIDDVVMGSLSFVCCVLG